MGITKWICTLAGDWAVCLLVLSHLFRAAHSSPVLLGTGLNILDVGAPVWVRHVHFEIFPKLAFFCGFTSKKSSNTYSDISRILASDQSRNAEWRYVSHPNCSAKFGRGEQHAWICRGTSVVKWCTEWGMLVGLIHPILSQFEGVD